MIPFPCSLRRQIKNFDAHRNEFLCPICGRLSNCILPLMPSVSNFVKAVKPSIQSFYTWTEKMKKLAASKVNKQVNIYFISRFRIDSGRRF